MLAKRHTGYSRERQSRNIETLASESNIEEVLSKVTFSSQLTLHHQEFKPSYP